MRQARAGHNGVEKTRHLRSADSQSYVKTGELLKILSHEKSRGCQDSAVIGGLGKYLARWKEGVAQFEGDSSYLELVLQSISALDRYSELSPSERAALLSATIDRLTILTNPVPLVPATPSSLTQVGDSDTAQGVVGATGPGRPRGGGHSGPPLQPPATSTRMTAETVSSAQKPPAESVLDAPATVLRGLNTATAVKLAKLGVRTVKDVLYFFPRRHNDFSTMKRIADLVPGSEESIVATVWDVSLQRYGRSARTGVEVIVGDESGNIRAVFFNQPYVAKVLRPNTQVVFSGKVEVFRGQKVFQSPQYENLESDDLVHTGRIVPVYPLTEGLYPRSVRRIVKGAVDHWASSLVDPLPEAVRKRARLLELSQAISQVHYPDSQQMLERAKERLAFDELFAIQLGALKVRREWRESQPGHAMVVDRQLVDRFKGSLPFGLTGAQERTLGDILADQASPESMTRLLQGEVGSGKTVVAAVALLIAVANGFQAVLMAPTEILAEQHFRTLTRLYSNLAAIEEGSAPIPRVILLTGSQRKREKDETHAAISRGEVDVVVGTHAIIQEGVEFGRMGLCIVDEQHRFGVMQRSALRQKGYNPDLLVMTATPIPRTLALTLYGDLDLSIIDELPPGRQEIKTKWLRPEERHRAYDFIRRQVKEGRQAFIICPLVEESDKIEAKAATAEYERLSSEVFADLRLGLLHGRLKPTEKDNVMRQFGAGELDILVSTTVIEVGIDVPNATVMLIEGADRFGLSQLHQLRGRVGRGAEQSYCILLSDSPSSVGRERLGIIEKTQDGFVLAEEDMRLRGPGEFLGTRQSGLPDLKIAKLSDLPLIELARREALALFEADPDLSFPEHRLLARCVAALWQNRNELS